MHLSSPRNYCLLLLIAFLASELAVTVPLAEQPKPGVAAPSRAKQAPFQPVKDKPGLPRILLIGDSISIGYTVPVQAMMNGKANVHRAPTNCGPTTKGIKELDRWIGKKPWDIIHFNWGLHDLKYMGPQGQNLADPKAADSHQQVPPAEYEKHLQALVTRLQKTGATLIWCHTTPVPPGCKGRVVGDSEKYNKIATKIMREKKIMINDLYGFCKPQLEQIQRPANVHFTPAGSRALGQQVARHLTKAIQHRSQK